MSDIEASMRQLIDHVVDHVPGVVGALVSSADGFVLASRLPAGGTSRVESDAASVAAMSAALLGLSNRLVQTIADGPVRVAELRSNSAQAYVFSIASAATLTVLADLDADRQQLIAVGRELTIGIGLLLRGTADV